MVGNFKINVEICIGIHLIFIKYFNFKESGAIDKIKQPPNRFYAFQGSTLMPVSCGFEK